MFARHYGGFRAAISALVLCSFFFYAWWNPPYFIVFIFSILTNYFIAWWINKETELPAIKRWLLIGGIVFNLALLGYFKYANFLLEQFEWAFGGAVHIDVLLPIGISFYTFQQIAFLVDTYQKRTNYGFVDYCLFVSFFPQLIAGPIVHHSEMMPQFENRNAKFGFSDISVGSLFFVCGLFKKVVIADNLSIFASPIFAAADAGASITFVEAWLGTFAYSMQLYFDFSGYSDMAIGLALVFGIRLPFNFDSPYKARNIIDFWRRWHMTLSRFLRDYLYIPLGGNRNGTFARYRNLWITMLIGGLWHGAGWGFVIWGGIHGALLCVNHLALLVFAKSPASVRLFPAWLCWTLTFIAVIVAWVPFRATTLDGALSLWQSMVGLNDIGLPSTLMAYLKISAAQQPWLTFVFEGTDIIELQRWVFEGLPLIVIAVLIALYMPNSQQLIKRFETWVVDLSTSSAGFARVGGFGVAIVFFVCVERLNNVSEFLYFQF